VLQDVDKGSDTIAQDGREERLPPETLALLEGSVGKYGRRQRIAAVCLSAAGLIAFGLSFIQPISSRLAREGTGASPLSVLRYGGLLFLALGLLALFLVSRNARRRRRVLSTLVEQSSEVAWVFQEELDIEDYRPDVVRTHICLSDGTHAWFQTDRLEGAGVFECFRERFERISLGYDPELERMYRRDPGALRRERARTDERRTGRLRYPFWSRQH